MHHHRLHHQLQAFHRLGQVIEGTAEILLESLHSPCDRIRLPGKRLAQVAFQLLLALAQLGDLLLELAAAFQQLSRGQGLPVLGLAVIAVGRVCASAGLRAVGL